MCPFSSFAWNLPWLLCSALAGSPVLTENPSPTQFQLASLPPKAYQSDPDGGAGVPFIFLPIFLPYSIAIWGIPSFTLCELLQGIIIFIIIIIL